MARWIDYLRANSQRPDPPQPAATATGSRTDNTAQDLIATAFFAYSTDLVRQAAAILGKDAEAATYARLSDQIKSRLRDPLGRRRRHGRLRQPDGLRAGAEVRPGPGQPARPRPSTARRQRRRAAANHLSTGFLGTPFLLNVLAGRRPRRHRLQAPHQDSYPGWGYMLSRGGTTIWERWDGIRPDGSLQDAGHELVQPLRARLDRRLALRRGRRPRARRARATRSSWSQPSTGAS